MPRKNKNEQKYNCSNSKKSQNMYTLNVQRELTSSAISFNSEPNASCSKIMEVSKTSNSVVSSKRREMQVSNSGEYSNEHLPSSSSKASYINHHRQNEESNKSATQKSLSEDDDWEDNKQCDTTNSRYSKKPRQSSELSHNLSRHGHTSSSVRHRQGSTSRERKRKNDEHVFAKKYIDYNYMEFHVVHEVQGDLFQASDEYSLGHCVAEDMNMGSGIATTFRQTFKNVDELLDQRQTPGGLAVLEIDNRFIYYLVTKRISTGKPTLHTLWCSLLKMKNHMVQNNVKKLALPRIGCGLDRLSWSRVKRMLECTFRKVDDVEIKIFNYQQDPDSAPPARVSKCPVFNVFYPITDIPPYTFIIYFGSEDGVETREIKSISKQFPYISKIYRTEKKVVGTYIRTDRYRDGYCFYGCIVRKYHTDLFNFSYFQKCLNSLQVQNGKRQYKYMAFQAFMEDGSTFIVSKIVNLMRNSLTYVQIYVCWPKELQKDMSYSNYF